MMMIIDKGYINRELLAFFYGNVNLIEIGDCFG